MGGDVGADAGSAQTPASCRSFGRRCGCFAQHELRELRRSGEPTCPRYVVAMNTPWRFMVTIDKTVRLNDGKSIPRIGFGVWRLDEGKAPEVVASAIEAGYRHIDTAQGYDNEAGVGE